MSSHSRIALVQLAISLLKIRIAGRFRGKARNERACLRMGANDTSFKPGQSGNPKGRPKGSGHGVSIARLIAEELEKVGAELENGEKITLIRAIAKSIVRKGAEGDLRAIETLLKYMDGTPVPRDKQSKVTGKPIKVVFGEDDAGL